MRSIRFKITSITVAAVLTAIVCVFLASFSIVQGENDKRSVEVMSLIAQDTRKSLEKYTEDIEQSVQTASNRASDLLDSVVLVEDGAATQGVSGIERTPEQTAHLDAYMEEYDKRLKEELATIAEHTRGVVDYYFCVSPNISTTVHGFYYSRVGKTGFGERVPLNACALDEGDPEHSGWYFTPVKRGRPSWIGPFEAASLDNMLICSYVVPIYKVDTLIGVLGMDIPLDTLVGQVSSIRVYETGFAFLVDENGLVVYHPTLERGSEPPLPVDESTFSLDDSGSELIRYDMGGEERQLSFTTLSNGMKLMIVAPTSEVNASSARLVRTTLPLAAIITIIFAGFIMVAMHLLTSPLLRLTAASQRLADADYDVELDYQSNDEVGALTASFKRMRDQIQAYIADLNRRVLTDDLTGLPNQRYFFDLAMEAHDELIASGELPSMLYFNLLGMKNYNLQYGFAEGDRLIAQIAQILASQFGERRIARFGQDHFAAVSVEQGLKERLDEILDACQRANGGKTLPVAVGIYNNSLEDVGVSVACDRAKYACDYRRGSYVSGYSFFTLAMLEQADMVRYVISHFDQALAQGWIKVYYQSIVSAKTGKVCDVEALSRWIDPERGFLSPADFIPALEDAGLIYRLDLYVIEQVLQKMRTEQSLGAGTVSHSVNLSRSDFASCDVVEEVCRRVDAAGIDRSMINIEITETALGSDYDFMERQVNRFHDCGFQVWMDDFGSEYSSLDYLQSLHFDLIKFDMGFMRQFDENEKSRIILSELMKMAIALEADTIAEGVETREQVEFLRKVGCSKLQGYYFARPMPYDMPRPE